MNKFIKPFAIASAIFLSSSALTSAAYAQVSNIAVVSREGSIASAKALSDAYAQIRTTFKPQFDEISGREARVLELGQQLDTNNDGRLTEQESTANPAVIQQITAENQEIDRLSQPIALAQMFALQQVGIQYATAIQQSITEKQVNLLLAQNSILFASEGLDLDKEIINLNQDVIAKLNTLVPVVNTNVPQGWQPDRGTQALYQQVQQIRQALAQQLAQQQAATEQPAAPPAQQPSRR